ncbi:hypothetical protein CBL_04505 [Carabus blaptoides fortunei]
MAKFTLYILIILLIIQKCTVSLADDTDDRVITEITEFLKKITVSIEDVMKEVSIGLPQVVSQFEINIKQNVDKMNSEHLADQTQTAMAQCISESRGKADVVKIQLQELVNRASTLGASATAQIQGCVKNVANENDVAGLASCLKQQGASIQETVDELRNEIKNTLVLTESVVADISSTLDACIEEAQAQDNMYDHVHTDEL